MPATEQLVTVALAGWAADGAVFTSLQGTAGRLIAPAFPPDGGVKELSGIISGLGFAKVRLLGWSLGALPAAELALARPDLVAEAVLVSARPSYPPEEIAVAREGIRRNRRGYLAGFFSRCFSPGEKETGRLFRQNLLPGYLDQGWDLAALERGLDRLEAVRLDPALVQAPHVRFVHGVDDRIAPFSEITGFTRGIPAGRVIALEGRGHMPFLAPEFAGILAA